MTYSVARTEAESGACLLQVYCIGAHPPKSERSTRVQIPYSRRDDVTYTAKGARPYPHEIPSTVHPGRDEALSEAERQHVRALIGSHAAGVNYALAHGDETAIQQEVPPTIRYRAIAWAVLHRTAMAASHYIAMVKATDEEAQTAAQGFADELRDLILKQVPNSRESIAEIEKRAA